MCVSFYLGYLRVNVCMCVSFSMFVCVLVSTWVVEDLEILDQCPSSSLRLSWRPPEPHLLGGPPEQVVYVVSYRPGSGGSEVNITDPYIAAPRTVSQEEVWAWTARGGRGDFCILAMSAKSWQCQLAKHAEVQ